MAKLPGKKQIQTALEVLVSQNLWSSGRAADLEWFQFGQRRTVTGFKGGIKEVGEYALHVQCSWRIRRGNSVIVGSHDLYHPADEMSDAREFDWQVLGTTRRDKRIADLFENETRQFVVTKVEVREAASFTLFLEDGYAIDVFPDDSLSHEHWRIFRPYRDEPHFVVSGRGICEDG